MAEEARAKVIFAELVALVPQDILKQQIKDSITQDIAETKNLVPFPKEPTDKVTVRLKIDASVPEEEKIKILEEFDRIFRDKTCAELEAEYPVTEHDVVVLVKEVKKEIIQAWVYLLMMCLRDKDGILPLNDDLLPATSPSFDDPSMTYFDFITRMVDQDIRPEQAKNIYLAFKDKVKEEVDKRLCGCGLEVGIDSYIKKNENGYFVTSKA